MKYNFNKIENKWQKYWKENQTYKTAIDINKPKFYVLDMFPYPSGAGLHVGHPLGYIASDIYARYKKLKGYNVLHPQGYDSFGLPAEQYAIQTGQHPKKTTSENINTYRRQLDKIGFSFDWTRELKTSSPDYYKWTQWIFIKLFNSWYDFDLDKARDINDLIDLFYKNGNSDINNNSDEVEIFTASQWKKFTTSQQQKILLQYRIAYLAESEVNWCPDLGTVLANDEIVNGVSERGGFLIEKRKMKQWNMKISCYANRLLSDLDKIDWNTSLKETQRNWIGKSIGCSIEFKVIGFNDKIEVFTTRPDTIFGVSFMTLAPEHELVKKITTKDRLKVVNEYISMVSKKSDRDRMSNVKLSSGVFTGAYVEHPISKNPIEIWIGDYVLVSYGTGAVMSVPCGDQRDFDFAKKYDIKIINIFKNQNIENEAYTSKENFKLCNSKFLDDLSFEEANTTIINYIEKNNIGKKKINFRLRDAIFSRQRYWGEPFPIYYKDGLPYAIDEAYLPLKLPEIEKYLPTKDGDPPLGRALNWAWDQKKKLVVNNDCIDNKNIFPLELNTMPGWAGSSWYFNRYMDPNNDQSFASKDALKYWKEVDLYLGGSEHATGHLLYSRFWQMFLYDMKLVNTEVYAKKLVNQGMILGNSALIYRDIDSGIFISSDSLDDEKIQKINVDINFINQNNELDLKQFMDWQPEYSEAKFKMKNDVFKVEREVQKMSKSKYNVVNPDDICDSYGADTLRLYEMFLGPIEQAKPWNTNGISGVFNFLNKVWKLFYDENNLIVVDSEPDSESLKILNQTIKKINHDIENFSFNTCVSSLMILVNKLTEKKCSSSKVLKPLSILLSPFAPHLAEELWFALGNENSITDEVFPEHDPNLLIEKEKNYPVSFNGKLKFQILLSNDLSKKEVEEIVSNHDLTIKNLDGRGIKKIIFVPNKIINVVC